jgi:PIN domain nuclease of toxin-antitoxin system
MLHLLDTHTFIWFINGDDQLSANSIKKIESDNAINFISIASIREIPITIQDSLIVSSSPFHHRDPFDRLIIAQSLHHKLSVITKDDIFRKYNTDVFW